MSPGKLFVSNDSSSPENYQRRKEKSTEDNNNGAGRSYNCNYCKRGFTNAQALGGHMNIHRKDKAKAKQEIDIIEKGTSIHNMERNEEMYSNFRYIPNRVPSFDDHHFQLQQQLNYYMSLRERASKYKVYLPPSNPNTVQSGDSHASSDGYDHENLSLKIGLKPRVELNDDGEERENDGVDLELRLGQNPKYGD